MGLIFLIFKIIFRIFNFILIKHLEIFLQEISNYESYPIYSLEILQNLHIRQQ